MRRLTGSLMLALVTGATVLVTGVSVAGAASGPPVQRFGTRLVDVPVSEARNPRGLRYIIDFLRTGTTIHRRILILNQESRTARFTVYPDAATIAHGLFTGDAGHTRNELTTWTSVQHPVVTLGPHSSAMDLVTIRVPRGATRGEHYGVIWAQQASRLHTASGVDIRQVARVGIRVYLAVGHGGAPPTKFVITSITGRRSAGGQPYILVHVRDTGGRAVDLAGTARLTDGPGNSSAGPFRTQQIITLAPGQSGDLTFDPGRRLPAGPWKATITLLSGLNSVTAEATIKFPGNALAGDWADVAVVIAGSGAMVLGLLALARILYTARARRAAA